MFEIQGRVLPQVEELGKASAFLPQTQAVMGRDSVFSRISLEETGYLAELMSCYRAPAGTLLIREGEASGFLVFVIEGVIEIRKQNHEGRKAVLACIGPGSTLGEMSLLDAQPRSADCVVMEPTTFAVLDRSIMDLLIRHNPALVNKILTQIILILSERLRQLSDILSETLQAQA
jgi:CRP-like cAMP-binding protein